MTDPTTQATRVEWSNRQFTSFVSRHFRPDLNHAFFNIGYKAINDFEVEPHVEPLLFDIDEAPDICAAIDTISGGEYRARIEREQWDRLFASLKDAYAQAISEPHNKDLYVHKHGLRWAMDELRAQQPSDQTQEGTPS